MCGPQALVLFLCLFHSAHALSRVVDPNGGLFTTISLALTGLPILDLNTVTVPAGHYSNEILTALPAPCILVLEGAVVVTTPGYSVWLSIANNLTISGNGSLQLVNTGIIVTINGTLHQTLPTTVVDAATYAVRMENGTWNQLSDFNISHYSSTDQGALVQASGGCRWNQEGQVFINTHGATGVKFFDQQSTWEQKAGVFINVSSTNSSTSTPYSVGVDLVVGGQWTSYSEVSISPMGVGVYGVYMGSDAVWRQRETAQVTLTPTSSGPGVRFEQGGTWQQEGPLILDSFYSDGVTFIDNGTWLQSGEAAITLTQAVGVRFVRNGGRWSQNNTSSFSSTRSRSVYFALGGRWEQLQPLHVVSSLGTDVYFNSSGTWEQNATATFNTTGSDGVVTLDTGAEWLQHGDLSANISGYGVMLNGGLWTQRGSAALIAAAKMTQYATWMAEGIHVSAGALWQQHGSLNLTLADLNLAHASGVWLSGNWSSSADSETRIEARGSRVAPLILSGGTYDQLGSLHIDLASSDIGSSRIGVRFIAESFWNQHGALEMKLVNHTGVQFDGLGGTSRWTQAADVGITATGALAAGVNLTLGQLTPSAPLRISAADGAKGVVCTAVKSCCNLIYSATSQIAISATGGSWKDDCPQSSSSPSPSSTPIQFRPVVVNTTATFNASQPSIAVQGTTSSGAAAAQTDVGVKLSLSNLQVGNASTSLSEYRVSQVVDNSTSPTNASVVAATTYVYLAQLDNATSLEQAYTFNAEAAAKSFVGTNFTVKASTLKWSINLTSSQADAGGAIADIQRAGGLVLRYELLSLIATNSSLGAWQPIRKANTPQANMTTYIIPLVASTAAQGGQTGPVAQVEVFDVALVDDQVVAITHDIQLDSATAGGSYALELRFPPFNRSLFYDPSLGLGVLLPGLSDSRGTGGGGDNTALIVAVAVVVPVAVLAVLGVIAVAALIRWKHRKRLTSLEIDLSDLELESGNL